MNNQQQQPPNGNPRMERVERAIEHLVGLQASHDARIDRLAASQSDHSQRLHDVDARIERLVSVQERHEQELDGLMEIVQRHAEESAQRGRETGQHLRDTDQRLNALIQIVDDIVRKRPPNGNPS